MQSLSVASFAVGLLFVLGAQGDEAALKKERAALQGKWKIVSFETAKGKDDNLVGATMEFDKDGKSLTLMHNNESKKGTFKLNPAGKPKEIDIKPADEDKTFEGIYQVTKDKLKICLSPNNGDGRPAEFATKEGKAFVLVELEREK
jgi:uncharacterized protein (TIGR03067 family)